MRAIMVSVDYADLLQVTLPYNQHHFDEIMVVTAPGKPDAEVAERCGAMVLKTDSFWWGGASFNKWIALEMGLQIFGCHGWMCIMDADVLWPKSVSFKETKLRGLITSAEVGSEVHSLLIHRNQLCSPLRRMCSAVCFNDLGGLQTGDAAVPEEEWSKFPIHRNVNEWAGYSQIFNCEGSADVLGNPPWHEIDWRHAGGADSYFQAKWPRERKVRPPWECLHIGEAGVNWFGRSTPMLDGTMPQEAEERRRKCVEMWFNRRGKARSDRFRGEKLEGGER